MNEEEKSRIPVQEEVGMNKMQRGKNRPTLKPEQILEVQKMVEDIGTDKVRGFMFVIQDSPVPDAEKKDGKTLVKEEGILFSSGIADSDALKSLLGALHLSPMRKVLVSLQLMQMLKDSDREEAAKEQE